MTLVYTAADIRSKCGVGYGVACFFVFDRMNRIFRIWFRRFRWGLLFFYFSFTSETSTCSSFSACWARSKWAST